MDDCDKYKVPRETPEEPRARLEAEAERRAERQAAKEEEKKAKGSKQLAEAKAKEEATLARWWFSAQDADHSS
jgi:hypothetical protein